MAYFQHNQQAGSPQSDYTRRFSTGQEAPLSENWEEATYDDGFDELTEEEFSEEQDALSEEEQRHEKLRKFRLAANIGDFGATLIGVLVILALVAFLISMFRFLSTDVSQSFSLLQTKF